MISSAVSIALDDPFLVLDAPKSLGSMLSIRAENSLLNFSKLEKSGGGAVVDIMKPHSEGSKAGSILWSACRSRGSSGKRMEEDCRMYVYAYGPR